MSEYIQLPLDFEIWKPVPGYEGFYEVSSIGRVKSLRDNHNKLREIIRKPRKTRTGYMDIGLKNKHFLVHQLVMLAFVGPPPQGLEINHKNGNKTDNRLENLEYVTKSYNKTHSNRLGLSRQPDPSHPGVTNGRAKLNDDDVRSIRSLYQKGVTQVVLGKRFGVSHIAIGFIVRGIHWRHVK